jgi:hypothetical protein
MPTTGQAKPYRPIFRVTIGHASLEEGGSSPLTGLAGYARLRTVRAL